MVDEQRFCNRVDPCRLLMLRAAGGVAQWLTVMCVVAAVWGHALPTAAQQTQAPGEVRSAPAFTDVVAAETALIDPDTPTGRRQQAAAYLLHAGNRATELVQQIIAGKGPDDARLAVTRAVASDPLPLPSSLGWALIEHLNQKDAQITEAYARALGRFDDGRVLTDLRTMATNDDRPLSDREQAVLALGHQRTKEAARTLIQLTDPRQPQVLRQRAFEALMMLTGRTDLDMNRDAWLAWWQRMSPLTADQWRGELINNFVRQSETAEQQRQYVTQRLLTTQRSLYRLTEPQQRPAMLVRMLQDPVQAVRLLAVDLAVERLLDNQPIPEELQTALRESLNDVSPKVRGRAALLLRDLNDEQAANRIALQLTEQQVLDFETLQAYLRVLARMPRHKAVDPALALLRQPELRVDAAAALAAGVDRGLLNEQDKQQAIQRVRQLSLPRPSDPELITLLAKLGDDEDWQHVAGWLDESDPSLREAAATAWAHSDRPLGALAKRADDEVILPLFLEAARQRGKDAATWEVLLAMGPPQGDQNQDAWRRALVAMASRVPPDVVFSSVDRLAQLDQSTDLIEQTISARLETLDEATAEPFHRVDLLLARARLRLSSGEPAQAMAFLDEAVRAMPKSDANVLPRQRDAHFQQIDRMKVQANLMLGQIDAAVDIAKRPLANHPNRPEASTDPQILTLFLDATEQRLNAQQAAQARELLDAVEALLGKQSPAPITRRLKRLREDAAALTPAVNGRQNANGNEKPNRNAKTTP